jgi:hypothetical protein
VWGKAIPIAIGKQIFSTQTIWQLSAGDEKSIPALKINILWDIADSIQHLVPTQFQESIFTPINRLKNRVSIQGIMCSFHSMK